MRLVYRFNNYEHNDELLQMCRIAKDLYNQALHLFLTSLNSDERKWLNYYDFVKQLPQMQNLEGAINYKLLKAQVSQQTLKVLDKTLKGYLKSIKDWKGHKEKYKGMPRPPRYLPRNGYFQLCYPNQSCSVKDGRVYLSKNLSIKIPQWKKYGDKLKGFQQVRILPKGEYTVFEIIYNDDTVVNENLNYSRYSSIDLGVNNLVTLVNDFTKPLLYNGKQVKSLNRYFNKEIARYKSLAETNNGKKSIRRIRQLHEKRTNTIDDLMHKVSRHIVRFLNENGIGNLVCGRNKGWKDSINLGKVNNQTFIQIPYERLISQLRYKCESLGIKFIEVEEGYTSKCDALANEEVCKHEFYSGKRVKRGLFQSGVGRLINADVNGALNILRKVVNDSSLIGEIVNSGWLFQPRKLNNLHYLSF